MACDGLGWPLIRSRGCYTCHIQLASVFRAPFVLLCKVNRLTDKVLVCWTIWHCASLFNVRNNGPVSLFWPSSDPIYQMPDWCTTQKVSVWIQPFLYVWGLIFAYLPPNCFTAKTQVTYLAGNLFNLQFRAGGTFRLHPHWEGGRGGGKKKFLEGIWGIRGGGDCIPETGVEFGVFAVENWVGCGWGRFRKSIVLLQAEMRRGVGRGIRAALKHPNIVPYPSIHATLSAR